MNVLFMTQIASDGEALVSGAQVNMEYSFIAITLKSSFPEW